MVFIYAIFYPFAAIGSIITTLLAYLVLNFFVALTGDKDGNAPAWLRLFQTFDATMYEGEYARQREIASGLGEHNWDAFNPAPTTWWQRYLNRWKWLQRNPAYGWDYNVWGMAWVPSEWRVVTFTNADTYTLFIAIGRGFNFFYTGPRGTYKLGWKAWNNFNQADGTFQASFGDGTRLPVCFSPIPWEHK